MLVLSPVNEPRFIRPSKPKILLVGQAFGKDEHLIGCPFVGPSGRLLAGIMHAAGITKTRPPFDPMRMERYWYDNNIALGNVVMQHPENNNFDAFCCKKEDLPNGYDLPAINRGQYLRPEYIPHLIALQNFVSEASPNIIVCLGNEASWAFTGYASIKRMQMYIRPTTMLVPGRKMISALHPTYVLRSFDEYQYLLFAMRKVAREQFTPDINYTKITAYVSPTIQELNEFVKLAHQLKPTEIGCDIETLPTKRLITDISFALTSTLCISVPFVDTSKPGWSYWPTPHEEKLAWKFCHTMWNLPWNPAMVWHNGNYDNTWLRRFKLRTCWPKQDHDTMLMHHTLAPELALALGTIAAYLLPASPAWKNLRRYRRKDDVKEDE